MISLFLNTSFNYLNIALVKNNSMIDQIYIKLDKDLSRLALFNIKSLLDKNSLKPDMVDEVVCVRGPGSFTGLRVGATISKVFTYFLNKELYSVSNLLVMVTSCSEDYIIPIIDARRGYVYGAIYDSNYNVILEESYIKLDKLIDVVSSLDGKYCYVSYDNFENINVLPYEPNIDNLYKNMKKNEEDPMTFVPNYLKKPEAEENFNGKKD